MCADRASLEDLEYYFNSEDYIAEPKYDGARYVMQIADKDIYLTSRRVSLKGGGMCEKSANVPHITSFQKLPILKDYIGTILDGEIVSPKKNLISVMSVMGASPETAIEYQEENGLVDYFVFDILEYKGEDVRKMPFSLRRELLERIFRIGSWGNIRLTPQVIEKKEEYYHKIIKEGGEGVVLKNLAGTYIEDSRPKRNWLKVKRVDTFDGIVIGGKEGNGKYRGNLGALIIGQYVNDKLQEVATISGMTDAQRAEFWNRIKRGEQWVVEFAAQEKTPYFRYRHPQYKRCRPDKNQRSCVW